MREYFDQKLWAAGHARRLWKKFFGLAAVVFILVAGAALLDARGGNWARQHLDCSPFTIALICGVCAIFCAIAAWRCALRYLRVLNLLGLARVYHTSHRNGQCRIWCAAPEENLPKPGNVRMVLSPAGELVGEARAELVHDGKLVLTMLDDSSLPSGSLVCLCPPHTRPRKMSG